MIGLAMKSLVLSFLVAVAGIACEVPHHGRTFVITNETQAVRYWKHDDPIALSRLVSGQWQRFLYEYECQVECTECRLLLCEACDPAVGVLPALGSFEVVWDGWRYLAGSDHDQMCSTEATRNMESVKVDCLRRQDAPAGTYRIEVCTAATYTARQIVHGSCWSDASVVSPATLDTTECVEVDFEFDPAKPGDEISVAIETAAGG